MSTNLQWAENELKRSIGPLSEVLSSHIFTSERTQLVHGYATVGLWSEATPSVIEIQKWMLNPYSGESWEKEQRIYLNSGELSAINEWANGKSAHFAIRSIIDKG